MNIWQVGRQWKWLLQNAVWEGSATPVFHPDSVLIVEQGKELDVLDGGPIPPLCILSYASGQSDPDHGEEPDLIGREMTATLVTLNLNDRAGEASIIGATRQGQTDSRGRGVLEFEQPLFATSKLLDSVNGVVIQLVGQGEGLTRKDESNNTIAIQDYTFKVHCATDLFYAPARRFTGVGRTGEVDLSWQLPATRYDSYRGVLVRKSGAVAPATPTDGTVINLAASPATPSSYADAGLAPGTYSYSLFMSYSEYNLVAKTDERFSAAASKTSLVAS